jgi:hypothetical protein
MPSSARCRRPPTPRPSRHTPRSVGTHNARNPPHTSASPVPLNTLAEWAGFASVYTLPMRLSGHTIGVLALLSERPGELPGTNLPAAQALADLAVLHHTFRRVRTQRPSNAT